MTRRLVVVRHAKAEPYAPADHARRLTARGRADALALGRHLAAHGVLPDHGLVSDAARAVETWRLLCEGAGIAPREQLDHGLYVATADTVVESLRLLPDDVTTAAYVGHNPTAEYLAGVLHDSAGDPDALRTLLGGLPTSAIAVFELPGRWEELEEASARLTHVHIARG